jgi:FlaA1/EpsC-like NDP-sugar epimerase
MKLQLSTKNLLRIVIDISVIIFSYVFATFLRVSPNIDSPTASFILEIQLAHILTMVVGIKLTIFIISGLYQRFWRYTKAEDIVQLAKALLISAIFIILPRFFDQNPNTEHLYAASFGVVAIDFFCSLGLLASVRLFRQYLTDQRNIRRRLKNLSNKLKNTLLIGAGEGGLEVLQALQTHPELGLNVVCVLDDDKQKHSMVMQSKVPVKGYVSDVKHWVDECAIEQIIIAIPSLSSQRKREIIQLCSDTGADIRIVPSVSQLAGGHVRLEEIRPVNMEDLLGRGEIDLEIPEVSSFLKGRRILVSGAGGSIGSEICRQIIRHGDVSEICLLGKGENSIFESWKELEALQHELENFYASEYQDYQFKPWQVKFTLAICDIRNLSRLNSIFSNFKPQVVFHAAAHKHVYLMELNPAEAFEVNILGSKNLMDLCANYEVENFVQISTDKAVNPTSIMGTTKRYAEKILIQAAKQNPKTKFSAVRFGNVLGSRGSVIKVWQKQLSLNKTINVTDKKAIRYFMTIPEASQLVIKAAAKANSGEIMILDMGEPINIYELAKQYILLSGFTLEEIKINITGLRPGEKLYEELLTADEFVENQLTDKIFKAKIEDKLSHTQLKYILDELTELAKNNQLAILKDKLKEYL